jgi:hypothetical protein
LDDAAVTVDLAHLDDATFQRLYKERIEPCFAANEEARLAAVGQFKTRAHKGGGVTLVAAVAALMLTNQPFVAFTAVLALGLSLSSSPIIRS